MALVLRGKSGIGCACCQLPSASSTVQAVDIGGEAMIRDALLSVHLLAVIVWIGVGFFELYLGRRFLATRGSPVEAPLIRIVYGSDMVVAAATFTAFAAGIGLALY